MKEFNLELATAVLDARDYLDGLGVRHGYKGRDPVEPGLREKELAELQLQRAFMQLFRVQARELRKIIETYNPGSRKAVGVPPDDVLKAFIEGSDDEWAKILRLIFEATEGGIALFAATQPIGIDYSLVSAEMLDEVREYVFGEFRDGINKTTLTGIENAITAFVETPGMTIGDVMKQLPFDDIRARRIAITEVTRAYAEGDRLAGKALAEEFPEVEVVKTWFTNNDDRVCPICGPNHLVTIPIDELFPSGDDSPPSHVNCRCFRTTTTRLRPDNDG